MPKEERQKYREALGETFRVLDTALNLVIDRLSDVLVKAETTDFDDPASVKALAQELYSLENYSEWTDLERSVRLCSALRTLSREMDGLLDKIRGRISLKDSGEFKELTVELLSHGEGGLADNIRRSLRKVALLGGKVAQSRKDFEDARKEIRETRDKLRRTREKLIKTELEFYNNI